MPAFSAIRPSLVVDGQPRNELQDALGALVVNLPLSGMAHAEVSLSNWGNTPDGGPPGFAFQDLGFGTAFDIRVGDDETGEVVFSGEVTGLEETYGDGAPQLTVLLQDKLHRMARSRRSRVFEDQTPNDVVQTLAGDVGLNPDVDISTISATFHQMNESDLAFLLRLTGRFEVAVRVEGENLRMRAEETDADPVVLDAQDSALKIRLLADLNHQPKETQVLGFNSGANEAVTGTSSALDSQPSGTTAANVLEELGWAGEEIVPQPFARSQGEADAFARGHFQRLAKRFVHGEVYCLGEPSLRSGREIELAGVSPRLRGVYQIVHCVHRFDSSNGFETHLKVNRPDWSPN